MNKRKITVIVTIFVSIAMAYSAIEAKSLKPLDIEDANTLPKGQVDIRIGTDLYNDYVTPFAPEFLKSDYATLPRFDVAVGIADNVELQFGWDMRKIDNPISDEYGPGDPVLATKVRILEDKGNLPALGVKFGVKIPSASNKDGLGTNEADFMGSILISKEFGIVKAHGNIGLSILGNPNLNTNQDDVMTYGLGLTADLNKSVTIGAEVIGQTASTKENDRSLARVGMQYNVSDFTVDAGIGAGLSDFTEDFRASLGLMYHWKAF